MTGQMTDPTFDFVIKAVAETATLAAMAASDNLSPRQFASSSEALHSLAGEIEDSLVPEHTPEAEESRQSWVHDSVWPHSYLNEAMGSENYQQMLHANLSRMGFPENVAVRRRGTPEGDVTNVSLDPNWEGKLHKGGELHSWVVPRSSIVGFGHPEESEVFIRTPKRS